MLDLDVSFGLMMSFGIKTTTEGRTRESKYEVYLYIGTFIGESTDRGSIQ